MDVEFWILRELSRSPLASTADLARAVGLTRPAVHARLRNLTASGALEGFVATPTPAPFGRQPISCIWSTGDVPVEDLLALDEVVWSARTVDGFTGCTAYTTDKDALLERISARFPGCNVTQDESLPRVVPTLGPLEWRVLRALIDHPRGPTSALAKATGLSRKTVVARRARLLETGAVRIHALLRPPRHGPIYFHMWVQLNDRDHLDGLVQAAGEVFVEADYGTSLYLFCRADGVREQREALHRVEAHADTKRAHMILNSTYGQADARLRAWIDAELERWRRAAPSSGST